MIRYTIGSTATAPNSSGNIDELLGAYRKSLDEQIKQYSDVASSNLVTRLEDLKSFITSLLAGTSPDSSKKAASILDPSSSKSIDDLNKQLEELRRSWLSKKADGLKESLLGKEQSYFKGIIRNALESTSLGTSAYKIKDNYSAKRADQTALIQQIRGLTASRGDTNATDVTATRELSEQKETNKLLRKMSTSSGSSSSIAGMFPTGLLSGLASFATAALPILAGVAIVGGLATLAYSLYKTVREEDKNNSANKAKNQAEIDAREAAKPASERLTESQKKAAVTASTLADNKAASNQSIAGNSDSGKTLNKLKSEYIKKRMPELNADPKYGTGEFNVREIASKEFDEYINNKGSDKSASVGRLVGDSLAKVANVAPTEQAKALGKTTFENKAVTVNPAAVSTKATAAKLTDLVAVKGGVDLEGLNDGVKGNLSSMATEFYQQTGKKLRVNSAKRSSEEQARLYKEKGPGWAAPPGQSMHEFGYAVDIDPSDADQLSKMGLMSKYGFTRPLLNASKPEPWHVEPVAIQGQKAAIRQGGGLAAAVATTASPSGASTTSDTEGVSKSGDMSQVASLTSSTPSPASSTGSASPSISASSTSGSSSSSLPAADYSRAPFEEPSTSVVVNTPSTSSQASMGSTNKTSLDSIPIMVENMDLILLNTGSI